MPSIPPAYLYTFIATLAVSSLLVLSFMAYANAARFSSELRELKELTSKLAARSTEMINLCEGGYTTIQSFFEMPTAIGHEQYWFQMQHDSQTAWIDSGLGNSPITSSIVRVYLPGHPFSTGNYLAGTGMAVLACTSSGGIINLYLSSSGGAK